VSEPKQDFMVPTKIHSVYFHGDVTLGFMTLQSATVDTQASSHVDKIQAVSMGEYTLPGGAKIPVGDGLVLLRMQADRSRPNAPKELRVAFTHWSNVKSVLYGA
jgi:hypothetical protein